MNRLLISISSHNRIPRSIKSPLENPLSGDYNKQMTPIRNFGHNFFFEIRLSQNFRKAKALNWGYVFPIFQSTYFHLQYWFFSPVKLTYCSCQKFFLSCSTYFRSIFRTSNASKQILEQQIQPIRIKWKKNSANFSH